MLWATALSAFVVTVVLLQLLLGKLATVALDHPNERSLHSRPVPRTGGLAVLLGAAVALPFGAAPLWLPIGLALALAALSFADDLRSLSSIWRLAGHVAAAGVFVWYAMSPMHPLELLILAMAVAWVTNLYNFMDGSDGLAGGMSIIGFGTYALAAAADGDVPLAVLSTALACASAGFLTRNFPPARIFLGDVGSIPLGFLAGALGVLGWRNDHWPLWFPLAVFAPFIGDATATLAKRALRGEAVWRAHREHYYQRLVRSGFGHTATALVEYLVMLACAAVAFIGRTQPPRNQLPLALSAAVLLAGVAVWIDWRWARFRAARSDG